MFIAFPVLATPCLRPRARCFASPSKILSEPARDPRQSVGAVSLPRNVVLDLALAKHFARPIGRPECEPCACRKSRPAGCFGQSVETHRTAETHLLRQNTRSDLSCAIQLTGAARQYNAPSRNSFEPA